MSADVLAEVAAERARQDEKWGEQNHPDGTGVFPRADRRAADEARRECQMLAAGGICTWRAILAEEVAEAFAETDPQALRAELVQVAAVATQWIEAIDRRQAAHRKCAKCDGCGRVSTDDEGTPWTFWENLPVKSAAAVMLGLVRPVTCPVCSGSGSVAA